MRDRRAIARYAGLTGSPDESGQKRREKGFPYASQQETVLDRANRKAFKLRRRLKDDGGIGDCIWKKPKGMHWRTFERLKAQLEEQDEIATFAFVARASKMIGWNWPG